MTFALVGSAHAGECGGPIMTDPCLAPVQTPGDPIVLSPEGKAQLARETADDEMAAKPGAYRMTQDAIACRFSWNIDKAIVLWNAGEKEEAAKLGCVLLKQGTPFLPIEVTVDAGKAIAAQVLVNVGGEKVKLRIDAMVERVRHQ